MTRGIATFFAAVLVIGGVMAFAMSRPMENGASAIESLELVPLAPSDRPAQQLRLATELGRLGLRTGDPLALGVAARYLSAIRVEPSDSEAAAWLQAERERFIAAGESIAGTDADMRAFLQAARDGTAATETTPAVQVMITDEIDPQSSVSFTLRVDQPTEILLIGDGGSDLDIEIVGPNGSVLCRSSGYSDREYCRIAPRGLETLSMRVTNRGRLSNRFLVLGA